jgi:hypothetical protein
MAWTLADIYTTRIHYSSSTDTFFRLSTISMDLTDENDGEEGRVGVDHAVALLPGAAATKEGHHKDDHA